MMILLLFFQKQNLASLYTCLGSVLASPDQGCSTCDNALTMTVGSTGALVIPLLLGRTRRSTNSPLSVHLYK